MAIVVQDDNGASRTDEPDRPLDEITIQVSELARLLSRLLELIVSRAAAQAASVSVRLLTRQRATERRLDTQAKEIADLHLRLDTQAGLLDDQEARIAKLEAREAGGNDLHE